MRLGKIQARGFTLLELMIVVAIIGVLAAIAVPAYQEQVRKTRRATAQSCLMEQVQFMERFYAVNLAYHQTPAGVAVAVPVTGCQTELTGFYTFDFSVAPTAGAFTRRASPVVGSTQEADTCGLMTVSSTGVKVPNAPAECWR